jgi:hypothetical protein
MSQQWRPAYCKSKTRGEIPLSTNLGEKTVHFFHPDFWFHPQFSWNWDPKAPIWANFRGNTIIIVYKLKIMKSKAENISFVVSVLWKQVCFGWALEPLLLTKILIKSKFSYLPLFFPNSPAKVKWGLLRHRRLLIANHLDESLQKANQKHEQQSDHIYYTLLWQVLCFAACTSLLSKSCKNAKPKTISLSQPSQHDFTCFHPILICRVTYWASDGFFF